MPQRVTMPALGESVTEGTVTRWLKAVGDEVAVDEPLLEVSTDKVDTEIPSPIAGVLQEILVAEDETVEVGADLAVIGDGTDAPAQDDTPAQDEAPAQAEAPAQDEAAAEPAAASEPEQDAASGHSAEQATESAPEQAAEPTPAAPDKASTGTPTDGPTAGASSDTGGTTVTMPALGESVTEGTVTRWLKAVGDEVAVDEPLLEVSTDKVDTEIPSPVAGTLSSILAAEDETVPVGADLAVIGSGAAPEADSTPSGGADDAPAAAEPTLADEADDQAKAHEQAAEQSAPASNTEQVSEQRSAAPEGGTDVPAKSKPAASAPAQSTPADSAPADEPADSTPTPNTSSESKPGPRVDAPADASAYVTPLVRKLATEHGVDLAALTGTGVGGRIRKQDVLDAAEAAKAAADKAAADKASADQATADKATAGATTDPAAAKTASGQQAAGGGSLPASVSAKRGTTEKMSRLRKIIAQRMVESLQTSAQLTTVVEVDVTKVARLRDRAKREFETREGVKLSFLPFFALAAVEALKANPTVNASVEGDQIAYHAQENLGIAVDTDRGLLVPVIRDSGDLNMAGLARKVADLAERTRNNKITPDELGGGTFTLTNTGSRGALFDTPIINMPQVAILGTGAVVKRPVVVKDADGGETIAIRSMVYLALSYDHRIVDGADAARFLVSMKDRLEEGAFDADLGL